MKSNSILLLPYHGDVSCLVEDDTLLVAGALGAVELHIPCGIVVTVNDERVIIAGDVSLTRCTNMILVALQGVSQGFCKDIEVVGVGYGISLESGKSCKEISEVDTMVLKLGSTNSLRVSLPASLRVSCARGNMVSIFGVEKDEVFHLASKIRHLVKVDPYKGKGIIYVGEKIRRKEGKKH